MNNTQFDALVHRLEAQALASPRRYRMRVALLALLGYAYIGAVLLLLVALVAACAALMTLLHGGNVLLVKLAFPLLVFAGVIAKSLWVKFEPPVGRRLRREEAPALFAEAEALRRALQAPRADVVLLTDDYNAAVSQVPRLGILGFPRNYLIVGLPLLTTLPAEEVRAVLAHEFAHLSRAHGKFGVWIYRVRASWYQLMERLDASGSRGSVVFRRFFDWYAPYFGAYTFVLRRQHEYEADRLAAGVVGTRTMVQTLVDLNVRGDFLSERYWPAVWKEADALETPPDDVFARLATVSRAPLAASDADQWVAAAFKRRTDTDDTHPALRDRVAALLGVRDGGRLPEDPALRPTPAVAMPAATHFLGASHAALAAEMGGMWKTVMANAWEGHRQQRREAREGLAALAARAGAGPLDADDRWQLADWTEDIHGAEAALPLFQALLRDEPEHLSAMFATGRILLHRGDEGGVALLERVMERDTDAVVPACGLVYRFLAAHGRLEEADRYRERGAERAALLAEAQRERSNISESDSFLPSELPAAAVQALVAQLDTIEGVRRVYLVRKVLRHFAENQFHVLVVMAKRRSWWTRQQKEWEAASSIAEQLELPPGVGAFALTSGQAGLLRPIKSVGGSLLYDAPRRRAERLAHGAARAAAAA